MLAPRHARRFGSTRIAGLENTAVSTTVTSTTGAPLVVERTMAWDATGYGGHGEAAASGAATTWYFAEGSQGFFDTYLLLANAGASPARVTVSFLTEFDGVIRVRRHRRAVVA